MEMEQAPGENYLGWSQLHWAFMQHLHQWHDRIFDGQEYMAKVSCLLEDRFLLWVSFALVRLSGREQEVVQVQQDLTENSLKKAIPA